MTDSWLVSLMILQRREQQIICPTLHDRLPTVTNSLAGSPTSRRTFRLETPAWQLCRTCRKVRSWIELSASWLACYASYAPAIIEATAVLESCFRSNQSAFEGRMWTGSWLCWLPLLRKQNTLRRRVF